MDNNNMENQIKNLKVYNVEKEGKKRMRQFGTVQVPSEAFLAVLKMD